MFRTTGLRSLFALGLAFAVAHAAALAQTPAPANPPPAPAPGAHAAGKEGCERAVKWLAAAKDHLVKSTEHIAKAPADKQAAAKALLDSAATHLPLAEQAIAAGNCKEALSQLDQFRQGREAAVHAAGVPPGGHEHGQGQGQQGPGKGGHRHGKPGAGGTPAPGAAPAAAQ